MYGPQIVDIMGQEPQYIGTDPRAQAAVAELMQGDPAIIGYDPEYYGARPARTPYGGMPPRLAAARPYPHPYARQPGALAPMAPQAQGPHAWSQPQFHRPEAPLPPPQGAAVVDRPATTRYDRALPVRQNAVAVGATVSIPVTPQVLFTPDRFIIPSNIAQNFDVQDINIATISMLVGNQGAGLPGRFFQENVDTIKLKWPTLTPGMQVIVSVQNVGGAVLDFKAAFFGVSAM